MGSATGGSIRMPAAHSGIVGLKPTFGRVSRPGGGPLAWTLAHVGPVARTVRDAALILQVVAGWDSADVASSTAAVPDYSAAFGESLRGVRIGVPRAHLSEYAPADPDVDA